MTIESLSEFYLKGYYSKIDFYHGLLDILLAAPEPDRVMEAVPPRLLEYVVTKAHDHDLAAGAAGDAEQQRIPRAILRWRSEHPDGVAGANGANGADESRAGLPAAS